jgi:hypothetical protein
MFVAGDQQLLRRKILVVKIAAIWLTLHCLIYSDVKVINLLWLNWLSLKFYGSFSRHIGVGLWLILM